ncbi:MAG: tyrosine--tRNA ligase [Candidatus Rokubacteria bacterium]|nr:tyrosine--tRNA ligase [Candidatus Rokubacteria bacterium]
MESALLKDFTARGLVADLTHPDELDRHLATSSRTVYCGFDPTADSLHVGSLLPMLALRRFQLHGHRPIVLIGGGTGLIGDPSGKVGERALNPADQVAAWAERLKRQVARFVDLEGPRAVKVLDNYAWLSALDIIPFLRDVGKEFSIGAMIARESVKSRLGRPDAGLSYTEFTYQVLQAYDFLVLCREHGCTLQIGGSDQWGNITAGIDLIRRLLGASTYGLTLPLVSKADGTKFGKTEAGTVWIDPAKTSPYEMYQFWINTSDADVVTYLKYFTFLAPDDIADLGGAVQRAPEKREAQRVLARKATILVHGAAAVEEAERISQALFRGDAASLTPEEDGGAVPGAVLPPEAHPRPVWRVLKEARIVQSTSEARRLIQQGGVEVNGQKIGDLDQVLPAGAHTIKLGKRRRYRVIIEG